MCATSAPLSPSPCRPVATSPGAASSMRQHLHRTRFRAPGDRRPTTSTGPPTLCIAPPLLVPGLLARRSMAPLASSCRASATSPRICLLYTSDAADDMQ
eukprot:10418264-Alexandrium_andersonii.AAC.1